MDREQIEKKIDPAEAGISMAGLDGPSAYINGKEKYRRIFIRLRTPQETLTCSPIEGGKDFAQRASIIENWFKSIIRKGNYILTFYAEQVTDEVAEQIESNSIGYDKRTN